MPVRHLAKDKLTADFGSLPLSLTACTEEVRGSTREFAALNLVRPQSVRKRFCQTGSYFGIKPTKLPNGKLLWPLR